MIRAWASNTFRAFSNRGYLTLWIGTTLSFLAFGMSMVVQGVVAFDITGENRAVGIVSLGMGIATLLIAPWGGVLADRLSKRRLVTVGQWVIGLDFFVVGVLIASGHITIFFLALSTFVMGVVFSFIAPARQAWIGELLRGPILANGIALQQLGMTATRVVGPFLAGALIAFAYTGTAGTYLVMSAFFVVVIATLTRVPGGHAPAEGTRSSVREDFLLGVRHLRERPRLMLLSLGFIGFVVGGFSYMVVIPGFVENELQRSPGTIGLLYGVSGVAGLAVTIGIAGFADSRHAFSVMLGFGLLVAVGLALLSVAGGLGVAVLSLVVIGAGSSGYQLLNNALVMQEADPQYFGRVMSITMLAWGINGLAAYPYGVLGDRLGERETLALMAAVVLGVQSAAIFGLGLVSRRAIPAPAPVPASASAGSGAE